VKEKQTYRGKHSLGKYPKNTEEKYSGRNYHGTNVAEENTP
jgi:hypothetical protein